MLTIADTSRTGPGLRISGTGLTVTVVLTAWFAVVIRLGAAGAFLTGPGAPPLPIALGFGLPMIAFGLSYLVIPAFRTFVLSLDPALIAGIQAMRFAGFGFLALAAQNVLPIGFSLGAGLGDMAIGVTAPWISAALSRRPGFARSTTFLMWNALGVLDLLNAVATGAARSMVVATTPGAVTMQAITQLPLVLVPAFLVPVYLMLHVSALLQARRAGRA